MATNQQLPPLLNLPGELRNQIYEYVAYSAKTVVILDSGKLVTLPHPLSLVSAQLRREFLPLYEDISLAYATDRVICSTNFDSDPIMHSIHCIPAPACEVKRTTTLNLSLTGTPQVAALQTFVQRFSEFATTPKAVANTKYQIAFDPETFDLVLWRCSFARLAKVYRFHKLMEAEQRVWEGIYWAFAEAAEKVDGVGVKEYASGYWKRQGGGLCFV